MGTHKDVELKVLASVCRAFEELEAPAIDRCLDYLNDRYRAKPEETVRVGGRDMTAADLIEATDAADRADRADPARVAS